VLRTNSKITPLQVMLRYRDLLRVEQLLRQAKAILATCPIYHSRDMAIRGHVLILLLSRAPPARGCRRMGRHPARS
jgi:transposase